MNDSIKINKFFDSVCEQTRLINGLQFAVRSNEPEGIRVIKTLKILGEAIAKAINTDSKGVVFKVSKGQSNLPKVIWVVFLPSGRKVYECYSVGMCFDKHGRGAVVGLMDPVGLPQGKLARVIRSKDPNSTLDVNGPNPNTHYNDRFINPKEFTHKKTGECNYFCVTVIG